MYSKTETDLVVAFAAAGPESVVSMCVYFDITHHDNGVLGNTAMADQPRTAEAVGHATDSE